MGTKAFDEDLSCLLSCRKEINWLYKPKIGSQFSYAITTFEQLLFASLPHIFKGTLIALWRVAITSLP